MASVAKYTWTTAERERIMALHKANDAGGLWEQIKTQETAVRRNASSREKGGGACLEGH